MLAPTLVKEKYRVISFIFLLKTIDLIYQKIELHLTLITLP